MIFLKPTLILALILSVFINQTKASNTIAEQNKIKIITSFSILSAITKRIGGDKVEVSSLIPSNQEPHDFNPKSSDLIHLATSQILILNGLNFEPWSDKLIKAAQFKGKIVIASKNIIPIKIEEKIDPHAWQDPQNIKIYADNILKSCIEISPNNKTYFETRTRDFKKNLDQLQYEMALKLKNLKLKIFINHGAFNYFAKAFSIEFIPLHVLDNSQELSAHKVAELILKLKKMQVSHYALEYGSSDQSVKQISSTLKLNFLGYLLSDTLADESQGIEGLFKTNLNVLLKINP